jgi:hypothetical protein
MRCFAAVAASSDHQHRCGTGPGFEQATLSAATDLLISDYVAWREARLRVRAAYSTWAHTSDNRKLAFGAYLAALDQEEKAADGYARRIEHVRRFISIRAAGEPEGGTKLPVGRSFRKWARLDLTMSRLTRLTTDLPWLLVHRQRVASSARR